MGAGLLRRQREDGVGRRFQIVEMGSYFDAIVFQRTARAMYAPDWREGRPREEPMFDDLFTKTSPPDWVERSPRLVKVLRLESYEDSLQNLVSREEERGGTETDMRYLFEKADSGATTLLNVDKLERPFDYTLQVIDDDGPQARPVDIVETANLPLGLEVTCYETWTAPDDREYLAVHSRKEDLAWLVLWRNMTDLDVEAERRMEEFLCTVPCSRIAAADEAFRPVDGCVTTVRLALRPAVPCFPDGRVEYWRSSTTTRKSTGTSFDGSRIARTHGASTTGSAISGKSTARISRT